jgi:hypothetical protein
MNSASFITFLKNIHYLILIIYMIISFKIYFIIGTFIHYKKLEINMNENIKIEVLLSMLSFIAQIIWFIVLYKLISKKKNFSFSSFYLLLIFLPLFSIFIGEG